MSAAADGVQRGKPVVTQAGTAPVLPGKMNVIDGDGAISEAGITWDAVPEDRYQAVGNFEVSGKAGDISVACKVLVVDGRRQNIAPQATPTASTNTPQDLGGVAGLNDGYEPENSADTSHGVWHNWLGDHTAPAWVQYIWAQPVTIDSTDAYYFKDGGGNFAPGSVTYEYLDEDGTWKPVPNVQGLGIEIDQYNTTTFDPVTTTALKMTMTPNPLGCGVIEWKVYAAVQHTVTFKPNGGAWTNPDGAEAGADLVLTAASLSLADAKFALTRSGYTFTGWKDESGKTYSSSDTLTVTGDMTLTAQWQANSTPVVPPVQPSTPSTTTKVEKNEDGSTTTTVTDRKTGTVTATTEKPDGTKEIVETKKDGTVTETVEKVGGSREIVETKKDGTVTETVEKTDGSKEVVETKTDGTVTETKVDPEGGKAEKVTDPEKNVEIKVTDAEGKTLAEVNLPAAPSVPETRFEDVPEDHWADKAIHEMAGMGVVNGVGNKQFNMSSNIKRGDLALMLARLSNAKTEDGTTAFTDVPAGKYYAGGVAWAAKNGVVTGRSADKFDPEAVITRDELAVMLYRYAKLLKMDTTTSTDELDAFADGASTPDWAADAMSWCIKTGLVRGRGGNVLDPRTNVTRAEVAVMLQRFTDLMK